MPQLTASLITCDNQKLIWHPPQCTSWKLEKVLVAPQMENVIPFPSNCAWRCQYLLVAFHRHRKDCSNIFAGRTRNEIEFKALEPLIFSNNWKLKQWANVMFKHDSGRYKLGEGSGDRRGDEGDKESFLKGKWMNANTEWQERFLLRFCEPQKHTKRRGKREGKANEDEKEKQEKTRKQINPHKWCLNGRKRQKTG